MKQLLVILTVAASNVCLSQIVVSVDDQNTLYRGYKNRVTIGTMDGRPFDLRVENGMIIYDTIFVYNQNDEPVQYVVNVLSPGSGRKTKVFFVDPDTGLPFDTLDFHVKNLPAPSIYLGPLEDGSEAPGGTIRAQHRLFAKYPPEIPFNVSFSVISWEVSVNGKEKRVAGKGASLTSEARDLIRQAESGDKITFMTITVGTDGKSRKKSAVFTVK